MRAKLLLSTAFHEIGDEEDVVVVIMRRGPKGSKCYSTLKSNDETATVVYEVGLALIDSRGKKDA
jgi:hypothetical protein